MSRHGGDTDAPMTSRWIASAVLALASFVAIAAVGDDGINPSSMFAMESSVDGGQYADVITPTFQLLAGSTGPNDLSSDLVIGGVATTLTNSCIGTSAGLTCTTAVANAGAGTAATTTILTASHAFDSTERGVVFGSGQKRLDPATSSTWDLGTQDFFIEGVIQSPASGAVILDKSLASTDGWSLTMNGTTAVRLSLRTGSVTTTVDGPSNNPSTSRFHFICFVDRSEASTNGSACYADGVQGTGVNMSARVATATNAVVASVGAISGGTSTVSTILELKTWVCTACAVGGAPNLTEWAPIARDRAAIANGVSPLIAAGSRIPATMTRASIANLDVVDGTTRMLYTLGNAGMRVAKRTAAGVAAQGFMPETGGTNIALQSQTFDTTWAQITAGDSLNVDESAGADRTATADGFESLGGVLAEHGVRQSITLAASTYTESAWLGLGDVNFGILRDATIANGAAWFDVATCVSATCVIGEDCAAARGTMQAGVSRSSASRWPVDTTGDGVADVTLCRAEIVFVGTAAAHNVDIMAATADNSLTYSGPLNTATDITLWGAMLEVIPRATSYIATTTVGASRAADVLVFDGPSNYPGTSFTYDTKMLCSSYVTPLNGYPGSIAIDTNNLIAHNIWSSSNVRWVELIAGSTASSWDFSSTDPLFDGTAHSIRTTAAANNMTGWLDGVSKVTDVSTVIMTPVASVISLSGLVASGATNMISCLQTNHRIYSGLYTPAQVP